MLIYSFPTSTPLMLGKPLKNSEDTVLSCLDDPPTLSSSLLFHFSGSLLRRDGSSQKDTKTGTVFLSFLVCSPCYFNIHARYRRCGSRADKIMEGQGQNEDFTPFPLRTFFLPVLLARFCRVSSSCGDQRCTKGTTEEGRGRTTCIHSLVLSFSSHSWFRSYFCLPNDFFSKVWEGVVFAISFKSIIQESK